LTPDKLGVAFGLIAIVDATKKQRTRYVVDQLPEGVVAGLPNGHWRVERPAKDARLTPRTKQ